MSKKAELVGEPDAEDIPPPCISAGSKPLKSKRIKRPMNPFMVWSSVERKKLAEKEPRLHNTELSKRLGRMWKTMTEHEKLPFRKEADKLKSKLMEEHPDYKYKPRRRKIDANGRNMFWGNMKVHNVSSATNELNTVCNSPIASCSPATTSAASSCCLLQPHMTSQSAWNSQLHDSGAYYYPRRSLNFASEHIQLPTNDQMPYRSNIPTFYANPVGPFGIPFHLSSNPHSMNNGYVYKTDSDNAGPSEVIQSLDSSSYDADAIPTPTDSENSYKKTFSISDQFSNEMQSKKEPNFDSDVYHFPLETPPRSPYISSPTINTALTYPLHQVSKDSAGRKLD